MPDLARQPRHTVTGAQRRATLSRLAGAVTGARLIGDGEIPVTAITCDSRRVTPGALFVAITGLTTEGVRFVPEALARGAAAVVSEPHAAPGRAGVPWLVVPDARAALAGLSRAFFGAPDEALTVCGITGTKGKTTTSILLAAALEAAGRPTGVIGTLGTLSAGHRSPGAHTTPEAPDLYATLDGFRTAGCAAAVLEVSSHALALQRVAGMRFALAVFTNLTRDHLDFHKDMESYFAVKARLFAGLPPEAAMAVNLDDPFAPRLIQPARTRVVTYGRTTRADIHPLESQLTRDGIRLRARTPAGDVEIASPLVGPPNLANLLAALAAAHALGLAPEAAARGLASVAGIPGRLERVEAGQDFTVLVDFAHTPDALDNVLRAARGLTAGRLLVVFGCGGDRDRGKRPLMGEVAARGADALWLTSDNPRTEDPIAIIRDVEAGFPPPGTGAERHVEADRERAIGAALAAAAPGDVVVIAGKGHETEQILADRRVPFDDREVARRALRGHPGRGR